MKGFGARIKRLRMQRGLTQTELAGKLGINVNTYYGYEGDRREPPLETVIALAEFFGVTVDKLLDHEKKNDNASLEILYQILQRAGYKIVDRDNDMIRLITPMLFGINEDGNMSMTFAKKLAIDMHATALPEFVTGLLQVGAPAFIDARIKFANARQKPIPFLHSDE